MKKAFCLFIALFIGALCFAEKPEEINKYNEEEIIEIYKDYCSDYLSSYTNPVVKIEHCYRYSELEEVRQDLHVTSETLWDAWFLFFCVNSEYSDTYTDLYLISVEGKTRFGNKKRNSVFIVEKDKLQTYYFCEEKIINN